MHCSWNKSPVLHALCHQNLFPLEHHVLPFPFSPPTLASRTVTLSHLSPFLLFFPPMSGSSSFKSQLRIPSLEKTSLSPRATVAFLGHSRSHYPRNTFLTILIEAVLIPWLVVWAPPPPHAHTWKLHDSRDTACLIYCFISPVWNECVCVWGGWS